ADGRGAPDAGMPEVRARQPDGGREDPAGGDAAGAHRRGVRLPRRPGGSELPEVRGLRPLDVPGLPDRAGRQPRTRHQPGMKGRSPDVARRLDAARGKGKAAAREAPEIAEWLGGKRADRPRLQNDARTTPETFATNKLGRKGKAQR